MPAPPVPDLPPPFTGIVLSERESAFAQACRMAPGAAAPTLAWVRRFDIADLAVVLAPGEDLAEARLAVFVGLSAAAGALAEIGPRGKRLSFAWPDAILCDGGLLGGARLAWPDRIAEDAVPAWLVLGVTMRVERIPAPPPDAAGPTALRDAGFTNFEIDDFVRRFARRLKSALDEWSVEGPRSPTRRWLRRAPPLLLSPTGDLLHPGRALAEALAVPSWLDPMSGEVRG
jgi:hypothetical protein